MREYDIIIIGASIAGGCAALACSGKVESVLVIDRKKEIGEPVACAEGYLTRDGSNPFFLEKFIRNRIKDARVYLPSGKSFNLKSKKNVALIIDRKGIEKDMAKRASAARAEILTDSRITNFDSKTRTLKTSKGEEYSGKIIIDASGPWAVAGSRAGLCPRLGSKDFHKCFQYTLKHDNVDDNALHVWFDTPGGYRWAFPLGGKKANVGVEILAARRVNTKEACDALVKKAYPNAEILATVGGICPSAPPLEKVSRDGLCVVGDAARAIFAHSGAGIQMAALTGNVAALCAVEAIEKNSPKAMDVYDRFYRKYLHPELLKRYGMKESMYSTDAAYGKFTRRLAVASGIGQFIPFMQAAMERRVFGSGVKVCQMGFPDSFESVEKLLAN